LKVEIEPTSAMAMAGVCKWLKSKKVRQKVLVILSGGNIDQNTMTKIWETDHLTLIPSL
jgi:threonine dehydratase